MSESESGVEGSIQDQRLQVLQLLATARRHSAGGNRTGSLNLFYEELVLAHISACQDFLCSYSPCLNSPRDVARLNIITFA